MRAAVARAVTIICILSSSVCTLSCHTAGSVTSPKSTSDQQAAPPGDQHAELREYRRWTLVNPRPVKLDAPGAVLGVACADPVAQLDDPHKDKLISVYVNEVGRGAMMSEKAPTFPVGSMIVKEKWDAVGDTSPVLLTAMVKRVRGFDPGKGDWEFLAMDGKASKIVKPGRVENCWSCHVGYTETDHVTRLYLPKDVASRLR